MTLPRPRDAVIAALAFLPLAACSSVSMTQPSMATGTALSQPDALFVTNAAISNANEIATAQLAQANGGPALRRFAAQMMTDHQMAAQKLAALAQARMLTPPTEPDDAHRGMVASLANVQGRVFDKACLDAQVVDHQAALALFESEARNGADPDIKAFAAQSLPMLRRHLAMAQRLDPKR